MKDYISIGSSPSGEDCAQVGSDNYDAQSRLECKVFLSQLRQQFGDEVGTAHLTVKSFPHDFGSYREVVCFFDDEDEEGRDYAFKLESETPEFWTEQSKESLKNKNIQRS